MKGISRLVYDFFLSLLLLYFIPKCLFQLIFYGKYKKSLLYRLGIKKPNIPILSEKVIWIHAISLGEAKASLSFVKSLKKNYPDYSIVYSNATETGFEEVSRSLKEEVDFQFYLPYDFSWVISPLVKQINPKLFVLVESDFWLNLLDSLKKQNSKVLVINGKISDRSFLRFNKYKSFTKALFNKIDHLCLQNQEYFDLFKQLNISEKKLSITGNLKFDPPISKDHFSKDNIFKKELGILPQHHVITIGSTHHEEESMLLDALSDLIAKNRNLKILIVPRHPERFADVENMLKAKRIHYMTYSSRKEKNGYEKVILIDAMGILQDCYRIADVAIVGGSYTKIGGHNLLEPLYFGTPTFYGPYTFKQKELTKMLSASKLGFQIELNRLRNEIHPYLYNEALREDYSKQAQVFIQSCRGTSTKTLEKAKELLV